jgi:hypothetical protein
LGCMFFKVRSKGRYEGVGVGGVQLRRPRAGSMQLARTKAFCETDDGKTEIFSMAVSIA